MLHYNPDDSIFTLTAVSENWRRSFASLDEALAEATARVVEQTPMAVYNAKGKMIVETWVSPEGFDDRFCW